MDSVDKKKAIQELAKNLVQTVTRLLGDTHEELDVQDYEIVGWSKSETVTIQIGKSKLRLTLTGPNSSGG